MEVNRQREPAPEQSQLGLGHRLAYVFHCCVRVIVITALPCHRDVERGLGRSFPPWVELALPPGSRAELLRLRAALDLPPARLLFYPTAKKVRPGADETVLPSL